MIRDRFYEDIANLFLENRNDRTNYPSAANIFPENLVMVQLQENRKICDVRPTVLGYRTNCDI
eukprot:snap_masked-scaffold_7-processed-gene-9.40-mRNA-1 protein AED:1.00 eAED:1.00 QI:0/0/0/0/1/1/2/0/62